MKGIRVDPETDEIEFYVDAIHNHGSGTKREWVGFTKDLLEQWFYQCDQNPQVDVYPEHPNALFWHHDEDDTQSINRLKRDKNGDWHARVTNETFRVCQKWVVHTFHPEFVEDCEDKTGSFVLCSEGMSTRSESRKRQKACEDKAIEDIPLQLEDAIDNDFDDYDKMPAMEYQQGDEFTCVNSSLASCFHHMGATNKKGELIAKFVHDLKDVYSSRRIKQVITGILHLGGWTVQYHKKPYDPLAHYEPWPTLVVFQDSKKCTRHCITIYRDMIFDSNKKNAIRLTKENLDLCSIHKGATFVKSILVVHFVPGPVVQTFLD